MKNFKVSYTVGNDPTIKNMTVEAETAQAAMAQLSDCVMDNFQPIEAEEICAVIGYDLTIDGIKVSLVNGDAYIVDPWDFAQFVELPRHQVSDEMNDAEEEEKYCKKLDLFIQELENRVIKEPDPVPYTFV